MYVVTNLTSFCGLQSYDTCSDVAEYLHSKDKGSVAFRNIGILPHQYTVS
jgi:hypothetical protein